MRLFAGAFGKHGTARSTLFFLALFYEWRFAFIGTFFAKSIVPVSISTHPILGPRFAAVLDNPCSLIPLMYTDSSSATFKSLILCTSTHLLALHFSNRARSISNVASSYSVSICSTKAFSILPRRWNYSIFFFDVWPVSTGWPHSRREIIFAKVTFFRPKS